MIKKSEYLYLKSQLETLEQKLFEFETTSEVYREWEKWKHLNNQEREELEGKWGKYYEDCKNNFWGKAYHSTAKLFKDGLYDVARRKIKAIIEWEKNHPQKKTPKIDGMDPYELKQKIARYFELKKKVEQLKKTIEEYEPVYEKQKDPETL